MDTIPSENRSMLPIAALLVGAVAIVLSIAALAKVSSVKKDVAAQLAPISDSASAAAQAAQSAQQTAQGASASVTKLATDTQTAFTAVAQQMGDIRGEIAKAQQAAPAAKGGKAARGHGPVVAGPGEYIVKSGDTLSKIARANHVSVTDLKAVNSGVNVNRLRVGQKLKLPVKGGAEAAPADAAPAPAAQ